MRYSEKATSKYLVFEKKISVISLVYKAHSNNTKTKLADGIKITGGMPKFIYLSALVIKHLNTPLGSVIVYDLA